MCMESSGSKVFMGGLILCKLCEWKDRTYLEDEFQGFFTFNGSFNVFFLFFWQLQIYYHSDKYNLFSHLSA